MVPPQPAAILECVPERVEGLKATETKDANYQPEI